MKRVAYAEKSARMLREQKVRVPKMRSVRGIASGSSENICSVVAEMRRAIFFHSIWVGSLGSRLTAISFVRKNDVSETCFSRGLCFFCENIGYSERIL